MSALSSSPHRLVGAFNFRDLGGLPVSGGWRIRPGRLFRSDTLQALTASDVHVLTEDIGLQCVVDLRLAREVEEEGRGPLGAVSAVRYFNTPLAMAATDGIPSDEVLRRLYISCLESPSLAAAVTKLSEVTDRPSLFHCAAGKDRTGILAAMVLSLVGVEEDAIIDDYLRSADNMPRIVDRFRGWPRYREHMEKTPADVYRVDASAIRDLLATLRARHGGAPGWAHDMGITRNALAALRANLVVPT